MKTIKMKYGTFTIFKTMEELDQFIEENEIFEFQVVEKTFYENIKYYGLDYKLPKTTSKQLLKRLPYRVKDLLELLTKLSVDCKQDKIEVFIKLLEIHLDPKHIGDCVDCFLKANMNKVGVSK